jgi:hypothetical protein
VENTKSRTKSSSDIQDISKVGIEIGKKKAKFKKCKSKPNDDDKTPSGLAIYSGQYLANDCNKLKPFGKAKVKQLREEAKRKEKNNKPDARSLAIVETQEEAPPMTTMVSKPLLSPMLESSSVVLPILSRRNRLDATHRLSLRQTQC